MSGMLLYGLIALVFAAFGGLAYGFYSLTAPEKTAGDRLRDLGAGANAPGFKQRDDAVERIAERLGRLANPTDEDEAAGMRLKLIQAGYTNRRALEMFNALRVVLALTLPIVSVPFLVNGDSGWAWMLVLVLAFAGLGYYGPGFFIDSQVSGRQRVLMNSFPDALDLLVSSVEAGLGLDAAFRRVSDEMEAAAPELAKEFQMVNHEISAGVTRIEALKHLGERTGLEEVNALVNMLTQAERFGTSIARSLRVHSSITRQKRMSRAEEEAAKVSPKLTVVMILFLMPCLLIVLLGPAAINIKHAIIDKQGQ